MLIRYLSILFALLALQTVDAQSDTLVFQTIPVNDQFNISDITDVNYDRQGNLWVSSIDGLFRYDGYTFIKYEAQQFEKYGLIRNTVRRSHIDDDGTMWFAGAYSIYTFNPLNNQLVRMTDSLRNNFKELYSISYFDVAESQNQMIFATKMGLQFYDKQRRKVIGVDSLFEKLEFDRYSTNAHVFKIEQDPVDPAIYWLLTKSGLVKYDILKHQSQLIKSNIPISFDKLKDRGGDMCIVGDNIFFLVNFLKVYSYNMKTQEWMEIPQIVDGVKASHMRNLLPYHDGVLLVYISHDLHYYNANEKRTSKVRTINRNDDSFHSLSRMGIDPFGHLFYIHNNRQLIESVEQIYAVEPMSHHVFYDHILINDILQDTMRIDLPMNLKRYERNLSFSLRLSNRKWETTETYQYKLGANKKWITSDSRNIRLKGVSPQTEAIYTRIDTPYGTFEGRPIQLNIEKYFYETSWFLALTGVMIIAIILIIAYLVFKRKQDSREYEKQLLQLQMDALRSQMNPHFLFNSLNSIKNYLVSRTKDEAADYITDFSKLMRMILENSRKKFLQLDEELSMLKLYIEMENRRLNGTVETTIEIHPDVRMDFLVAPMLLQPYVENAMWHGLTNKIGKRLLFLGLTPKNDGVECIVRDNGVGRDSPLVKKYGDSTSKKSLGTRITGDRVRMINTIFNIQNQIEITDLYDTSGLACGTQVRIFLPYIERKNND